MPPEGRQAVVEGEDRFLASIKLHTAEELSAFLDRAEELSDSKASYHSSHPIAVVLHGPEVDLFSYANYRSNKGLINKAAQLDALGLIDVKVCETYMRYHGITEQDLPPYVDVVPFGPALESQLREQGYQEF